MIDAIIAGIRFVLDPLLNPLLLLGQDWALVITAIMEALLVVLVRRWTTPQEKLHRLAHDKAVQKHIAGLAKARGDRAAAAAHKALRAQISLMGLRHELLPLCLSVPAVLILAAWGYAHLPFVAAQAGAPITVNLYSQKLTRAGEVVVLEPQDGLSIEGGPVRVLRAVTDPAETLGQPPYSQATWTVQAQATVLQPAVPEVPAVYANPDAVTPSSPARPGRPAVMGGRRYVLTLREGERVHQHPMRVGGLLFDAPIITHDDTRPAPDEQPEITTEVALSPFKLFGFIKQPAIPGVPEMPPWMFAYVLVILPFYFIWKRLLRVA